jgi:hypothetical protein
MNLEKSPLNKMILGLCSQTQTDPTEPQDSSTIRPNQIIRELNNYYKLTLRKATIGRPSNQEKTGYAHTAHKMRWKLSQMYDHMRKATIGRPSYQEKTGYAHTAHKMRWKLSQMYDHMRKATIGRPSYQEKTGYAHTAHKMRWKLSQMYDHIRDTYFP